MQSLEVQRNTKDIFRWNGYKLMAVNGTTRQNIIFFPVFIFILSGIFFIYIAVLSV